MKPLIIEATDKTPSVILDPGKGEFEIKGKSIPNDSEAFYGPILEWINEYAKHPNSETRIVLNFEFFNISSSKRILFMLYRLNEMVENGSKVSVQWHYSENDDDMYEVGQDYAFMVNVPFDFVGYKRSVEAV